MADITRRAFLGGALAAAALAGCDGPATGADGETTAGTGDAAREVLRFGMRALGAPLDMQKNGMSVAGTLTDSIFEGLLTWTDDLELVPTLLTAVPTFEADGVTLPCELVEGVRFHDGSALTAADVKFTFERMFDPATGAANYVNYLQIKGARAMLDGSRDNLDEGIVIADDTHFSFVLAEPSAIFVPALGIFYAHIFPRGACAAAGDAWGVGANAIGTGKFRLVSNDDATEAVFERFDGYHGQPAALDEVRIVFYADDNTKLLAFKNGDIDWCDIGFSLYGQYKDDPDFVGNTYPYQPLGLQFVNLNLHDAQLADPRVREALSLAIDRQGLIDTVLDGQGQAASGFLTPQIPGFDTTAPEFAYDPERARALLCLTALLAPLIAPHDPNAQELAARLEPPGAVHPLGTDELGRDILSRLIYGSRISLSVGAASQAIALTLGFALGACAGYLGGRVDAAVSFVIQVFSSFPFLLFALVTTYALGPGLAKLCVALGLIMWTTPARLVRGEVLRLKGSDYVLSCIVSGGSPRRVIVRHLLPNCASTLVVAASLGVPGAILCEASLSFLGMGVQPPIASWGQMASASRAYLQTSPCYALAPGVAIIVSVMAFNLLGDALRDALDPRLRGS